METATKRLYEAMFLVDSASAAADWDGTIGAIETVLERANAEVVFKRKWADQRLAYEIKKVSRGTYMHYYFNADTQSIAGLEKDVRLSEKILRVLVLAADERPEGFNEKDMSETPKEAVAAEAAEDADSAPVAEAPQEDAPDEEAPAVEKTDDETMGSDE